MNKDFMWAVLMHLGNNMWNEEGNTTGRENNLEAVASPVLRFDRKLWDDYMVYMKNCGVNTVIIDVAEELSPEHPIYIEISNIFGEEELREWLK